MINSVSNALTLTPGNSLVLYRNTLPERYFITVPIIEVVAPKKPELILENQQGNEVLYYDKQGHLKRPFQMGLFINALF